MNNLDEKTGIWFVYDGECPMCNSTAQAIRMKEEYGSLHLIDARTINPDDALIKEINHRGLDLDEGMVIYNEGQFYHGKHALKFMAKHGTAKNGFTAICKALFWSKFISSLTYPWMRGTRNLLLRHRNVGRIDNLNLKDEPIFKSIFGDTWDSLPPVMHKHYANHPYSNDLTIAEGRLDVICAGPMKLMAPIMKLMGQIPPHNEENVPVTVRFQSDLTSKSFHFNRIFNFKKIKPYNFKSRMVQIKDNEVIEIMHFGLGWKMLYSWDGEKVILQHNGYAWLIFGHLIPLPLTLLMGKGYAEETPVDDDTFDMITHITHPWWGKIYQYKGQFKISKVSE